MIRSILPGGRTAKSIGAYLRNLGDSLDSLGLSFQSPLGNKDTRTFWTSTALEIYETNTM